MAFVLPSVLKQRQPIWLRRIGIVTLGLVACLATLHSPVKAEDLPTRPVEKAALPALEPQPAYWLHLHHTHTGESIHIKYREGNTYLPEAIDQLNHFLRDHRTQDDADYDPREFDLLHALMEKLHKPNGVIDIICGYRTEESNEFLRTRAAVTGVAEHSQHILSKAIDIRVPGVKTLKLRNTALSLGMGGVGYYPTSQFVHVDVGPVREWSYSGSHSGRHHRRTRARRTA